MDAPALSEDVKVFTKHQEDLPLDAHFFTMDQQMTIF